MVKGFHRQDLGVFWDQAWSQLLADEHQRKPPPGLPRSPTQKNMNTNWVQTSIWRQAMASPVSEPITSLALPKSMWGTVNCRAHGGRRAGWLHSTGTWHWHIGMWIQMDSRDVLSEDCWVNGKLDARRPSVSLTKFLSRSRLCCLADSKRSQHWKVRQWPQVQLSSHKLTESQHLRLSHSLIRMRWSSLSITIVDIMLKYDEL